MVLRDDVRLPITKSKTVDVIVARSLCLFACEDASNIPQKFRQKHIQTRLTELSPFQQTGHYVCWFGHQAAIWFWDASNIQRRLADLEIATGQFFPESLFYDRSVNETICGSCVEGIEEQVWDSNGALVKSVWRPTEVSGRDVNAPKRQLNPRSFQTSLSDFNNASNQTYLYSAVGVLFVVWAAWLLGELAGVFWQKHRVTDAIAELEQASESVLTNRTTAVNAASELKTIAQFVEKRDSYEFFNAVSKTLNEVGAVVVRWNLEENTIVAVVRSEVSNPLLFVGQLQQLDGVESVQISKSGQNQQTELVIKRP